MTDSKPVDAALSWLDRSFLPVPVKPRSKKPYNPDDADGRGWQDLRITVETVGHFFNGANQNIGVLLGDDFGSADVDLDCREVVCVSNQLLPETGLMFGRASKPASHWFYRVDPPIPSLKLTDPTNRTTLLELRCRDKNSSVGHQTVVPPSIHESAELIRLEQGFDGRGAHRDAAQLEAAVKAAAAILARHWPEPGAAPHERGHGKKTATW